MDSGSHECIPWRVTPPPVFGIPRVLEGSFGNGLDLEVLREVPSQFGVVYLVKEGDQLTNHPGKRHPTQTKDLERKAVLLVEMVSH